ncbi:hypothetical protein A3J15_01155 [Candidatus Roizmanbacteria bacterium RIFCSPLOWO2_02_FULL_38_10]|uniref:Uncharacterized protein n=1 Tax=Candidatus Roizmanbacteria bacterium RIFCSPLOWO2_02_FULL_38_10 TaxID=1802074 RepID=A0A1F7JPF0_9BACT|nr:MAG: hypothetical protein A3J15_01155 [Candidatus Roizmanbacteria bacterium RIFCSPLOWO2_02_FULL_38_10]
MSSNIKYDILISLSHFEKADACLLYCFYAGISRGSANSLHASKRTGQSIGRSNTHVSACVPWHEAPRVLTGEYNTHNPEAQLDFPIVDPANPIRYPIPIVRNAAGLTGVPIPSSSSTAEESLPDVW